MAEKTAEQIADGERKGANEASEAAVQKLIECVGAAGKGLSGDKARGAKSDVPSLPPMQIDNAEVERGQRADGISGGVFSVLGKPSLSPHPWLSVDQALAAEYRVEVSVQNGRAEFKNEDGRLIFTSAADDRGFATAERLLSLGKTYDTKLSISDGRLHLARSNGAIIVNADDAGIEKAEKLLSMERGSGGNFRTVGSSIEFVRDYQTKFTAENTQEGIEKIQIVREMEDHLGVRPKSYADGRFEFSLSASGVNKIVAECGGTLEELKQAHKYVQEMCNQKQAALTSQYNVRFYTATDGDSRSFRPPTLPEVIALESALARSAATLPGPDEDPLVIMCRKDRIPGEPGAQYNYANKIILFDNDFVPAMAKDTEQSKDAWYSLELVALHELAHHSEKVGRESGYNLDWGKLGWRDTTNSAGENVQLLEDKDGSWYRFTHENNKNLWKRCTANGDPLNQNEAGGTLTDNQMREQARVRPIRNYFQDPRDHFADGLAIYRAGREQQEWMEKECPELYKYVAAFDQFQIDRKYGTHPNGASRFWRNRQGLVEESGAVDRELPAQISDVNPSLPVIA